MPPNEDKKKKGGLLNDLAMGLGLKERDASYYNRTAKTIGRTQGADAQQRYMRSSGYGKPQAGLLSFMGGGSSGGSSSRSDRDPSRGFLPTLFGYRDMEDMFDRGGPYASGGMYQGAGGYSLLANLAHAASGQEFGERTPYEKVQAQAVIKSTNGAVPEATRNAISSLRPMLRPETNPYGVGGGFDVTAPPAMTNPYGVGGGLDVTAAPQMTNPYAVGGGLNVTAAPQPPSPAAAQSVPEMGIPAMGGTQDIASMRNELANAGIDTTYMPNDLIPDFYNTYLSVNR